MSFGFPLPLYAGAIQQRRTSPIVALLIISCGYLITTMSDREVWRVLVIPARSPLHVGSHVGGQSMIGTP